MIDNSFLSSVHSFSVSFLTDFIFDSCEYDMDLCSNVVFVRRACEKNFNVGHHMQTVQPIFFHTRHAYRHH